MASTICGSDTDIEQVAMLDGEVGFGEVHTVVVNILSVLKSETVVCSVLFANHL